MNKKEFGERIKKLRVLRGYSQKELADRIQAKSPQSVYGWEHGLCYPDLPMVEKLCRALDVTTATLFDEHSETVLTEDENMLVQKYRQIDTRARKMIVTVLDQQVAHCQNEISEKHDVGKYRRVKANLFLKAGDPDYEYVRKGMEQLEAAYRFSVLDYESLTRLLWDNGYHGKISITKVKSIVSGHKMPCKKLFNDMFAILAHQYEIHSRPMPDLSHLDEVIARWEKANNIDE